MKQPEKSYALYQEKIPGVYAVITENLECLESRIDLELLFNAVLQNKQKINHIFQGGTKDE